MFELVDQALDGFGEIRHLECSVIESFVMECGGSEESGSLEASAEDTI
jgi:hypothetical protein